MGKLVWSGSPGDPDLGAVTVLWQSKHRPPAPPRPRAIPPLPPVQTKPAMPRVARDRLRDRYYARKEVVTTSYTVGWGMLARAEEEIKRSIETRLLRRVTWDVKTNRDGNQVIVLEGRRIDLAYIRQDLRMAQCGI